MTAELIPWQSADETIEIEWPEAEWGLQIDAGGDEGLHCILPPHTVKAAVDALDQAYESASNADKKKIEKAVDELYGGFNQLRKTTCIIIRFYHWAAEFEAFPTFKHLLEDFVVQMDEVDDGSADDHESDEDELNNDNNDDGTRSKSTRPASRRTKIPKGKRDALKGLKLLFTGIFNSMDHKTCKATVTKYGGKITTKLEDSDYVILGVNAGPKKLEIIRAKELTTTDEEGFFKLLQGEKPRETQDELTHATSKPMPSKAEGESRKKQPEGRPDALGGLKVLFTGTLETIDRATAKKTAEKHGAKVTAKLEDTDYVILGTNPGPKKVEEIEEKGLKTISEQEFLDMLKTGEGGAGAGADRDGDEDEDGVQGLSESKRTARPASSSGTRASKRARNN